MDRRHTAVTLPVALYGGLHLLGVAYPVQLWGVDQLYYYSWPVQTGCALLFCGLLVLSLRDRWLMRVEGVLCSWVNGARSRPRLRVWLPRVALAGLPLALYAARDRSHTLGDSASWFTAVEGLVTHGMPPPFTWALEPLDFGLHLGLYWLARQLLDCSARDVYEVVSCVAGAGYAYVAYRAAWLAGAHDGRRALVLGALLTLGSVQLFFGYGESYTLATVGAMVYVWLGLRFSLQRSGWQWPALALLLTCACHLMALSLVPSFAYLLWQDQGPAGRCLRNRRVAVPVLVAAAAAALALYLGFYRHHHLPLLRPDAAGRYPIMSLAHFGTLGNEVLLLSPYGLVWGAVALARRQRVPPTIHFLGWGALGSGALVAVHNITMGGRDWDLMSFPGSFYTLWGLIGLLDATNASELRRGIRLVAIPALAIHTALWLGINASHQRSVSRLGALIQYTNQETHYRYFTQGYYLLAIRGEQFDRAAWFFQRAVETAPTDELERPGTRPGTYRKFLASALTRAHRYQESLVVIRSIYQNQVQRFLSPNDVSLHDDWAYAANREAEVATMEGDTVRARQSWEESLAVYRALLSRAPTALRSGNAAAVLNRLGRHAEAIEMLAASLAGSDGAAGRMLAAADDYLRRGQPAAAALAYGQLLGDRFPGATAAECIQAGDGLYRLRHPREACVAYRRARQLTPGVALPAMSLAWCPQMQGEFGEAVRSLRELAAVDTTRHALYALGLTYLRAGEADSARAVYARAVARSGSDEGRRLGMDADLRWLVERGEQAALAREILSRYWP